MAAFTATATPEVRDDIVDAARPCRSSGRRRRIRSAEYFAVASGRYRVTSRSTNCCRSWSGPGRALVYASTRRKAETAAETLKSAGVDAAAYHAGLADGDRSRVQERFTSGSLRMVCATNAFGMGIDRPDVETVVHLDIPGSLEAYYQEIGRAGRDGRPSAATLLWNYVDVKTREFLIDRENEEEGERDTPRPDPAEVARRKELDHRKLRRMVPYADTAGCLRATILRYFGDPAAREPCGSCGNCVRLQRSATKTGCWCERSCPASRGPASATAGAGLPRCWLASSRICPSRSRASRRLGFSGASRLRRSSAGLTRLPAAGLLRPSDDQYRTLTSDAARPGRHGRPGSGRAGSRAREPTGGRDSGETPAFR